MKADYYRYAWEFCLDNEDTQPLWNVHHTVLLGSRDNGSLFCSLPFELNSIILSFLPMLMYRSYYFKKCAWENYKIARKIAKEHLMTTHPITLGLALNYTVFWYEVMKDWKKANRVQKKAYDAALSDLDTLTEDSYKDASLILQLLRDGCVLYTPEEGEDQDKC
jgi:hypothetical protein